MPETRPLLQGARLTAYELAEAGIRHTLVTDNATGAILREGAVAGILVGADRIAANGDTANKIGTYNLAVLARHHDVPFYVVAPTSTIDPATPSGDAIPIEQRAAAEVTGFGGVVTAPIGTAARNDAFDVTPAALIDRDRDRARRAPRRRTTCAGSGPMADNVVDGLVEPPAPGDVLPLPEPGTAELRAARGARRRGAASAARSASWCWRAAWRRAWAAS